MGSGATVETGSGAGAETGIGGIGLVIGLGAGAGLAAGVVGSGACAGTEIFCAIKSFNLPMSSAVAARSLAAAWTGSLATSLILFFKASSEIGAGAGGETDISFSVLLKTSLSARFSPGARGGF